MAKKPKMMKRLRRQQTVERYAELRKALIQAGDRTALSKLPRGVSPVRVHGRCALTGRPRGYLHKYGMSCTLFRELAHWGEVPDIHKPSW